MHVVFSLAQRISVLAQGHVIVEDEPAKSKAIRRSRKPTLRSTLMAAQATQPQAAPSSFFTASDLHSYYGESYIVQGVSLELNEGEILPSGRTALARHQLFARLRGWICQRWFVVKSGSMATTSPGIIFQAAAGICPVPEDRRIIQGRRLKKTCSLPRSKSRRLVDRANLRSVPASW